MPARQLSSLEKALAYPIATESSRIGLNTIIRGLERILDKLPTEAGWEVRFELKCALRDAREALAEVEHVCPSDGCWKE